MKFINYLAFLIMFFGSTQFGCTKNASEENIDLTIEKAAAILTEFDRDLGELLEASDGQCDKLGTALKAFWEPRKSKVRAAFKYSFRLSDADDITFQALMEEGYKTRKNYELMRKIDICSSDPLVAQYRQSYGEAYLSFTEQ